MEISFYKPYVTEEEISEVVDSFRSGWITTGPKVKRFEEEFASSMGSPAALAVNSGTAALHVALATLGIGPGNTVITTPMSFCSGFYLIDSPDEQPLSP